MQMAARVLFFPGFSQQFNTAVYILWANTHENYARATIWRCVKYNWVDFVVERFKVKIFYHADHLVRLCSVQYGKGLSNDRRAEYPRDRVVKLMHAISNTAMPMADRT